MPEPIRICALGVPGFRHDGLAVGARWSAIDPGQVTEKTRAALIAYTGKFVQIHPADVARLGDFGLALVENRLVKVAESPPPAAPEPDFFSEPTPQPEPAPAGRPKTRR